MSNSNQPIKITNYKTFNTGNTKCIQSIAWSSDSQYIASGSTEKKANIWNINGENLKEFECDQTVSSVSFNIDNTILAVGSSALMNQNWGTKKNGNYINLWNINSNEILYTINRDNGMHAKQNTIKSISFSPNNQYILYTSTNNTIGIFDVKKQEHVQKISSDSSSVAWNPNIESNTFVSGSNRNILIWTWKRKIIGGYGYKILKTLYGHKHIINSVDWSHDGKYIVSGASDGTIKVWDPENGTCIKTIQPTTTREYSDFDSVSFCPINSNLIVSIFNKNLLQIWDINGTYIANLTIMDNYPNIRFESVAWSPDGNNIVAGLDKWDNRSYSCNPEDQNCGLIKMWNVSSLLTQTGGKKQGKKATLKKAPLKKAPLKKANKIKKLIDTYKKSDLVKIAKKHEVSLKTRDDKVKTKLQLFNSLKRKGLL